MVSTYLGYPFNPELFLYGWKNAPDLQLTALLDSGAVQTNGEIQSRLSEGSDTYTVPYYNVIGGEPSNYDGQTDVATSEPDGFSATGVVYGRAKGWTERDFIVDYNSGADPMTQITSQVAKYWAKQRQTILLKILEGVFSVIDDNSDNYDEFQKHITDISSASATVTDANKVNETTLGDAIVKAVGDNADIFSLAVMHSTVANSLAKINVMDYAKYTDPLGIQSPLKIGYINGLMVVIDDGVPFTPATSTAAAKYTTYLLGKGSIQYATAPTKTPVELDRDGIKNGGQTTLITRLRETLHPLGFTYEKPTEDYTSSPTLAQLGTGNWKISHEPKGTALVKVVSNG